MNEVEFKRLEFSQQAMLVFYEGEFVSERQWRNHSVCLYVLHDFYLELHYSANNNSIERIEVAVPINTLTDYVSDEQIMELLL